MGPAPVEGRREEEAGLGSSDMMVPRGALELDVTSDLFHLESRGLSLTPPCWPLLEKGW